MRQATVQPAGAASAEWAAIRPHLDAEVEHLPGLLPQLATGTVAAGAAAGAGQGVSALAEGVLKMVLEIRAGKPVVAWTEHDTSGKTWRPLFVKALK